MRDTPFWRAYMKAQFDCGGESKTDLCELYEIGVQDGIALRDGVVESRDSAQIGQTGSAQAKPENSDTDFVCRDIAPSPNVQANPPPAVGRSG